MDYQIGQDSWQTVQRMKDPRPVTEEMLKGALFLRTEQDRTEFGQARKAADNSAGEILENPILLAWFDRNSWTHSPAIC